MTTYVQDANVTTHIVWVLKQNAVCGSVSLNTSIEIIFKRV